MSIRIKRTSERELELLADRINRALGLPSEPYTKTGTGKYEANIGTHYIDYAYGSAQLVKITSEGGSVSVIIGFTTRGKLYEQMGAYLRGLELPDWTKV